MRVANPGCHPLIGGCAAFKRGPRHAASPAPYSRFREIKRVAPLGAGVQAEDRAEPAGTQCGTSAFSG
jgi:hypothetical protein